MKSVQQWSHGSGTRFNKQYARSADWQRLLRAGFVSLSVGFLIQIAASHLFTEGLLPVFLGAAVGLLTFASRMIIANSSMVKKS